MVCLLIPPIARAEISSGFKIRLARESTRPAVDGQEYAGVIEVLAGSGDVDLHGRSDWSNGTMTSASGRRVVTSADGGVVFNSTGSKLLHDRTLNNMGTATVTGSVAPRMQGTAVLNNHGTFDLQTAGGIGWNGGQPVFNNYGTVTKSGGGGISSVANIFHNAGSVTARSGALRFRMAGIGTITSTARFHAVSNRRHPVWERICSLARHCYKRTYGRC